MSEGYIHGFSASERDRLVAQARTLESGVFDGWDLGGSGSLLEIGCGVGAELEIVAERWPEVRLFGIDHAASSLAAAHERLGAGVGLVRADAAALPFADGSFDRAVTIWMLEHVPDPVPVLREALRVVARGGLVECLEVDNASFRLDPPIPVIGRWFDRFNRVQQAGGGDPFVGPKLAGCAERAGARRVEAKVARMIDSRAHPEKRETWIGYLESLLLSGAETLVRSGEASADDADDLSRGFAELRARPEVEFRYFATRMRCSA